MFNAALTSMLNSALVDMKKSLSLYTPLLSKEFYVWAHEYYGTEDLASVFTHPRAFPMLLFPYWLEFDITGNHDMSFQKDLTVSTICGYQYIRIIDNVMDENAEKERGLLPVLGILHSTFQSIYFKYFGAGHPFWEYFNATWFISAEFTLQDTTLDSIDEKEFHNIAARKTCAVKIPMAAVCYYYNAEKQLEKWNDFINLYGSYHQMYNDLFDWQKDLEHGNVTYLTSRAKMMKDPDESETSWIIKEGFTWATKKLDEWMANLIEKAGTINNPDLIEYLNMRDALLKEKREAFAADLQKTAQLFSMLRKFGAKL